MKIKRKYSLVALMGLSLVTLIGCANNSSSNDDKGSDDSLNSATSSESSDQGSTTKRILVSLEKQTIPEGTSFYDGCKPSVIFQDDEKPGKDEEVKDYKFKTKYTVKDKNDSTKTYNAGDYLPASSYVAEIEYNAGKRLRASVNFEVIKGTVENGEENKGYKTYTTAELEKYSISKYHGIATLDGHGMPAVGDVKILVIPVQFTNTKFANVEETKKILNEAFFATSDETPWESLSSYYEKASFGKLHISGVVTDPYTYEKADTEVDDSNTNISREIAVKAVAWLKENGMDMKEYDADKDGYIDGIQIVYNTSHLTPSGASGTGSDNSTWWNYTTNAGGSANVNNPGARRMFWSRWDYVTNAYYAQSEKGLSLNGKKVDAHTIIHETGHMMGAPDYYSYDKTEGPAGCVDMMDNNVGDHNAYTKMFFNWVAPKVVDGSSDNFTVTLNSYVETGEFLLVPKSSTGWNGSPYDEYLIIEYYTPTGVNEMDSTGYPEWQQASTSGSNAYGHGGTYEKPGIQVFHVDARAQSTKGQLNASGNKEGGEVNYTDTPKAVEEKDMTSKTYETAAKRVHDNTPSRSKDAVTGEQTDNRELQVIYPSGVNSTTSNSYYNSFGSMKNLFGDSSYRYKGETESEEGYYGGNMYSNFKMRDFYPNDLEWNDSSINNWSFSVTSQTDTTVTLHFVNNK